MKNPLHMQGDEISSLLFRVGGRLCALPLTQVVETMRPLPIEPLGADGSGIKGISIIRGEPLPVVELAAIFANAADVPTRFLKVKSGTGHVVLAVDSVRGISNISAASLRDLPVLLAGADNSAVAAIGSVDAELLILLNAARLVPDGAWPVLDVAEVAS